MAIRNSLIVVTLLLMLGMSPAAAQHATPAGDPMARLQLPEFSVTVSDGGMEPVGTIPAGPVSFVVDNRTDAPVLVTPMQIAESDSIDDFILSELSLPALPPAFHRATWVGGATALPGETSTSVVLTLTPGQWYLYLWDAPAPEPIPFTVTESGSAALVPLPDNLPTIAMKDFAFILPDRIEAGTAAWKVTNAGEQVHDIHILKVPDGTTVEIVKQVFFPDTGATPVADLPDPEEFVPYAGIPPLSQGQTFWTELSFESGTYLMVTWFAERDSGELQLELGMLEVFEVA